MRAGQGATPSFALRLPDSRRLSIQQYGDPAGPPVLYFHGWPACRLEAGLIPSPPVRLLAVDRPGYGQSSPHPGRTLLDWPDDIAAAADQLGLGRFHLVGLSGGAPYAAACAWALPHRIRGLALVCPVPPPHVVPPRHPGLGRLLRLARRPRTAILVLHLARRLLEHRVLGPPTLLGRLPPADRAVLTPQVTAALAAVWRHALSQGIQGALSDARIYATDWGFPLEAIQVPTALWQAQDDSLIPAAAQTPFHTIPNLRHHHIHGEGHLSLPLRHTPQILQELLAQ